MKIKVLLSFAGIAFSAMANAVPLPDFIAFGRIAPDVSSVQAYLYDQPVASAELVNEHYKLSIPTGERQKTLTGEYVELWVNGLPTGKRVEIGKFGSVERIDLD